jgi:hypothetical protein
VVAAPDDPAFNYPAQHSTSSPQLFLQSRPDLFHLVAGRAHLAYFEAYLADPKLLPETEATHLQPVGRDVLADNPWPQVRGVQSLAVDQQDLTISARTSMRAALKAGVGHGENFDELLHRQALLRRAEEVQNVSHIGQSPAALRRAWAPISFR